MRRTWRARARRSVRAVARGARTSSPASCCALFGFIPWRAMPAMPVEIMLFPTWFPFHLDKISYWSRTVIVPMLVLMVLKPRARNPKNVRIDELFLEPPETLGPAPKAPQQNTLLFWLFRGVDNMLRFAEPMLSEEEAPAARHRQRGGLDRRAAQRRRRSRRDLSGDGQQRDDVRRAGLSARIIRSARSRAARSRSFWWCRTARGLLPAVRLADLGHRACGHALLGNRRRRGAAAGAPRRCTGSKPSRCSTSKATGWRGGRTYGPAAGRSSTPIRITPMSTTPPWWSRRWIARTALDPRIDHRSGHRARARMDPRTAKQERRLGRVRRRQRISLSQQHPVRRPRRAARSADRGRHRALRVDAGAARRDAAEFAGGALRRSTISSACNSPTEAGTAAGA